MICAWYTTKTEGTGYRPIPLHVVKAWRDCGRPTDITWDEILYKDVMDMPSSDFSPSTAFGEGKMITAKRTIDGVRVQLPQKCIEMLEGGDVPQSFVWEGLKYVELSSHLFPSYPTLPEPDPVNHPKHHTSHPSGVECITIAEHFKFNLGNVFKYMWRAEEKGAALQDLEKAEWYLKREIEKRRKELRTVPESSK